MKCARSLPLHSISEIDVQDILCVDIFNFNFDFDLDLDFNFNFIMCRYIFCTVQKRATSAPLPNYWQNLFFKVVYSHVYLMSLA